jgi:hypothetical protein
MGRHRRLDHEQEGETMTIITWLFELVGWFVLAVILWWAGLAVPIMFFNWLEKNWLDKTRRGK